MYYKKKAERRALANRNRQGINNKVEKKPETKDEDLDMIYTSTYMGDKADSDQDEYHITMPFDHNKDLHHEILNNPQFDSDEDY